jgi:hypothetical protein
VTDPAYNDPQAYGYIIAWVELRDFHPSADISCTLYNVANAYSDGSYFYKWVGPVTSASSGYPPQLLGFWGLATLDARCHSARELPQLCDPAELQWQLPFLHHQLFV